MSEKKRVYTVKKTHMFSKYNTSHRASATCDATKFASMAGRLSSSEKRVTNLIACVLSVLLSSQLLSHVFFAETNRLVRGASSTLSLAGKLL